MPTEPAHLDALRHAIYRVQTQHEDQLIEALLLHKDLNIKREISSLATQLAKSARTTLSEQTGLNHFVQEYDLRSEEGVLLMCLSEALLRIPDNETRSQMVDEILALGHWEQHLGNSPSLLVNASTWGLYLGARFLKPDVNQIDSPYETLHRMTQRLGKNVAQAAMSQAIKLLAEHFVMGTDIHSALTRAEQDSSFQSQSTWSFDCLGEAAQTAEDVEGYFAAYSEAIEAVGRADPGSLFSHNGLSIKLSALHPRYDTLHRERCLLELVPRLRELVIMAMQRNLPITLDAEESHRLELSLDIFYTLRSDPEIAAWPGLGLALQAYQKRARAVLEWLRALSVEQQQPIAVRLVKGAYWDSEIKWAQQAGLEHYPVFTRKAATDVNYLACASFLLDNPQQFYPQFATHNAYSIAFLLHHGRGKKFEFQRLHGMGDTIYKALYDIEPDAPPCRVYAPVGQHETLLPYLVRRLLENGANSSFINQLADETLSVNQIVQNPFEALQQSPPDAIPYARDLYQPERINSQGLDLHDPAEEATLLQALADEYRIPWHAHALINGETPERETVMRVNPANLDDEIGSFAVADVNDVERAYLCCVEHLRDWQQTPLGDRAACLEKTADLFEQHRPQLMARIIREGGRTIVDAMSEVREAVDFCRYYAAQARQQLSAQALPGPTGEDNQLHLIGRGVFSCISPWNFPLAIFVGQIGAALVSGNAVLAKPAGDTPLTGQLAIELLLQAGIPSQVLHYLPGDSRVLGSPLLTHPQLSGVAFTGSFETAQHIHRTLAQRDGPILPLIAETGGVNVMIADSSTLPDQLVNDVLQSAFNSVGQRCSALRLLLIQDDIAETVLSRLSGALQEWKIGDPAEFATDIGPVINAAAKEKLSRYCHHLTKQARLVQTLPLDKALNGHYIAPHIFEIDHLKVLPGEVFGPILHVMRYRKADLGKLVAAVNQLGYGLTMGVHSRLRSTWNTVREQAQVGNLYINRNMIGAVVGSQPFGGEGLSGTGPKAGGPHYLPRFCHERSVSINTAAIGGNAELLQK